MFECLFTPSLWQYSLSLSQQLQQEQLTEIEPQRPASCYQTLSQESSGEQGVQEVGEKREKGSEVKVYQDLLKQELAGVLSVAIYSATRQVLYKTVVHVGMKVTPVTGCPQTKKKP